MDAGNHGDVDLESVSSIQQQPHLHTSAISMPKLVNTSTITVEPKSPSEMLNKIPIKANLHHNTSLRKKRRDKKQVAV